MTLDQEIEKEALKLIKQNTYKETVIKDSLLALKDFENIRNITKGGYDFYSSDGIRMFQGKIYITIGILIYNNRDSYNDSYHKSAYFKKDKEIVLKTLFKYDKKSFFSYHFNQKKPYLFTGLGLG